MPACANLSVEGWCCLQVTAALLRLAPFISFALFMLAMFYSVLDPMPLCMVTKIAKDAVKAMRLYMISPQAASCALMVTAVSAAFVEV